MKRRLRKHTDRNSRIEKIRERKAFVERLSVICEKLVGPGYFQLLPTRVLQDIYCRRYPPLKFVLASSRGLSQTEVTQFRHNLSTLLSQHQVETLIGEYLPYSWYLRDALLLIHYVQLGLNGGFSGAGNFLRAFQPYFMDSPWYSTWRDKTYSLITAALLHSHDFNKGLLDADIDQMPINNPLGHNTMRLFRIKPEIRTVRIDGVRRPLMRLGWYDTKHGVNWSELMPDQIGIRSKTTEALPVYVQQHALNRFCERTLLPGGFAISFLTNVFARGIPIYNPQKNATLVAFFVGEHKIGYFVIKLHQDILVVHTFLFLTNDGTPEGSRLASMTRLQLLDKQFLGIDRMDSFVIYNITGDDALRQLFIKAGCESLLNYANEFCPRVGIDLQNTGMIHQYLGAVSGRINASRYEHQKSKSQSFSLK